MQNEQVSDFNVTRQLKWILIYFLKEQDLFNNRFFIPTYINVLTLRVDNTLTFDRDERSLTIQTRQCPIISILDIDCEIKETIDLLIDGEAELEKVQFHKDYEHVC